MTHAVASLTSIQTGLLSTIRDNLPIHHTNKCVFYQIGSIESADVLNRIAAAVDVMLVFSPRPTDKSLVTESGLANVYWLDEITPYETTFLNIDAHLDDQQSDAELKILAAFRGVIARHSPFITHRAENETEANRCVEYLKTLGYASHYFALNPEGETTGRVYNLAYSRALQKEDPIQSADYTGHPKSTLTNLTLKPN